MGWLRSFWREIAPDLEAPEHILGRVLMLQKKRGGRRGETKTFQAEVQGDTEKLQRRERSGLTTRADGESDMSSWDRGNYAEFAADQKAGELLEQSEAWKPGVSDQRGFHKSPFVSTLPLIVCNAGILTTV